MRELVFVAGRESRGAEVGATRELIVAESETHEVAVGAMCELVFVAGHESREDEVGATRERIVAESETHEFAVGATRELVAGGKTHEAAVGK